MSLFDAAYYADLEKRIAASNAPKPGVLANLANVATVLDGIKAIKNIARGKGNINWTSPENAAWDEKAVRGFSDITTSEPWKLATMVALPVFPPLSGVMASIGMVGDLEKMLVSKFIEGPAEEERIQRAIKYSQFLQEREQKQAQINRTTAQVNSERLQQKVQYLNTHPKKNAMNNVIANNYIS